MGGSSNNRADPTQEDPVRTSFSADTDLVRHTDVADHTAPAKPPSTDLLHRLRAMRRAAARADEASCARAYVCPCIARNWHGSTAPLPFGGAVSAARAKPAPACDGRSRSRRPETGGDQRRMAGSQPLSLTSAAARFAIASFLSAAILSAAPGPIASRTASRISIFGTLPKYPSAVGCQ